MKILEPGPVVLFFFIICHSECVAFYLIMFVIFHLLCQSEQFREQIKIPSLN